MWGLSALRKAEEGQRLARLFETIPKPYTEFSSSAAAFLVKAA